MTYYEVLGIPYTADNDDIDRAYRAAIRNAHPDLGGTRERAAKVNEAYSVLSDFVSRQNYDRTIGAHNSVLGGARLHAPVPPVQNPGYSVAQPSEFGERETELFSSDAPPKVSSKPSGNARPLAIVRLVFIALTLVAGVFAGVTANTLELGLLTFVIVVAVLTATLLFVSPIRHPWWFFAILVLGFAIPMDELRNENLLPSLLEGAGAITLLLLIATFVFAVGYRGVLLAHRRAKAVL